jgi:hypothetical protein
MVQEKKILPSRVLDDENKGIGLDLGFESIASPLWNSVLCMWKQKFLLVDRARSYRATWLEDPLRLCLCRHVSISKSWRTPNPVRMLLSVWIWIPDCSV